MTLPSATPRPDVTVLITVYNGLPYLEEALRSIMTQTLQNIEILVIDDGSSDGTPEVLARLAAEDPRIRIEMLPTNHKPARASNHGLTLARAPLIARMDADDIAVPNRLEVQKRYMDAHPDVVVVGGGIRNIRADGSMISESARARDDFSIRWLMKFKQSIHHPTWMMRSPQASGLDMAYNPEFPVALDHEFLSRMMRHGKIVGLPGLFLLYRVHPKSLTSKNWVLQKALDEKVFIACTQDDYPASVLAKLDAVRAAYFRREPVDAREVILGFRALLAHDTARYPRRRHWLLRNGAQLIYETLRRAGYSRNQAALAFARHSAGLLPALALRFLETHNILPRVLDTEPKV